MRSIHCAACEICKEGRGTEAGLSPCTSVSAINPHPNNKSQSSAICRLSFVIIISNIIIITNNKTDSFKTAVPKDVIPPIAYHFNSLNPIINFLHVISTTRTGFFIGMELTDWSVKEKVQKSRSRPVTGPKCSSRLKFIEFLDRRHMKVARLSALNTGRLYPPGDNPGTHIC